ncbi:long-chain fatty acid--CoA ligase [Aliivibrio finisterrensis]|uniref:Long-chain fatty acid--CoA ligase n=1 Tax=Aliivibrio finisterrensis TaxID=511998 RepID=A0A6N6RVL8_9GAMM|nr:long-chain fatty acid--CoA ligase [Aliivibrio finisterrensis]KAB2825775.1 long-chain fatty acid--CoA ligase [Aliivibrio finisterrensis]
MEIQVTIAKNNIIASSEIDDLIFMSSPKEWEFKEQQIIQDRLVREAFHFHYNRNETYRNYCITQHVNENIHNLDDIPVFPTSVFKQLKVHTADENEIENWYTSSGTSGVKSYIGRDRLSIERLLGSVNFGMKYVGDWFDHQMELVNLGPDRFNTNNVWFKYVMSLVELLYPTEFTVSDDKINFEKTIDNLLRIYHTKKDICLIGPPYFVYLLCQYMKENRIEFNAGSRLYIITGGGWKSNQSDSLNRDEFNQILMNTFQLSDVNQIRDTFNQVELNTCFFEDEYQRKHVPPWVYARALDPETLEPVADGEIGLLSYMDASSTGYPAFILTDDIGIIHNITAPDPYPGTTIEIVRRLQTRAQKGCALSMTTAMK